jgi:hypothetical protein
MGNPVQDESVSLTSARVSSFQRSEYTNGSGLATFNSVPAGAFTVQARIYGDFTRYAGGSGVVGADQTLTVDLSPVATGTVSGYLYRSDGNTPVSGEWVTVISYGGGGSRGWFYNDVRTDNSGRYEMPNVPSGTIYLAARDPDNYGIMATAVVTLTGNGSATANLTLGNAVNLDDIYNLDGADDGFRYDLYYNGHLRYGGTADGRLSDAYDYSHYLYVNGDSYYNEADSAGTLELDGRQVYLFPYLEQTLIMSRKVFVPSSGRFARYLEVVHNPTAVTLPATVRVETELGAGSYTHWAVTPHATGNTYAVATHSNSSTTPAVGLVFSGAGAVGSPAAVSYDESEGDPYVEWKTSLGPGETAIFMHFTLQREPADGLGARAQGEALVSLTDPDALAGLTEDERAAIRNFTLDGVLGSIDGVVYATGGTTPVAGARLQVVDAGTGKRIASATAGADGAFSFAGVLTSPAGFVLRASSPTDPDLYVEQPGVFAGSGSSLTLPLTLEAMTGEVSGKVYAADGTPFTLARIEIARASGASAGAWTTAGPDGSYRLTALAMSPGGFIVRAFAPGLPPIEQAVVFATNGDVVTRDLTLPVTWGSIEGVVYAGDGRTNVSAEVALRVGGTTIATASSYWDEPYRFDNVIVPSTGVTVVARHSNTGIEASVEALLPAGGGTATADITLPLSIVKGRLTFADGTPPPMWSASAIVVGVDGTARWADTDEDGNFLVLGIPVGPFTITGQYAQVGLSVTGEGEITDVAVPVFFDLKLPATTTVVARVVDSVGAPVPYADVNLFADRAGFARYAASDENGEATFDQVPVGALLVRSQYWGNTKILVGATGLAIEGEPLVLVLTPLATGVVEGTFTASDGTPFSNVEVALLGHAEHGLGVWDAYTGTDESGHFRFEDVPAGAVTLWGWNASYETVAANSATLTAGDALTIDLQGGTGVPLEDAYDLVGQDGFRYDIDWRGRIRYGGMVDSSGTYYRSYALTFNNEGFYPYISGGRLEESGSELWLGPAGELLQATRKIFVPAEGGFARYVETITNPTPLSLPVTLEIGVDVSGGEMGGRIQYTIAPQATGNTYAAGMTGSWAPALGFVFGGTGAGVLKAAVQTEYDDYVSYRWTTTVPPGATIAFMHFAIQRMPGDTAAARAQAEALVNLTDPKALQGLTDVEKAQVVNFRIVPAP